MKKFIVLLCLSIMLLSAAVYADEEIKVTVNGKNLVTDVAPQLVNDRTMLPMRAIFESLGANVTWIEEDELIFATKSDSLIVLKIGSNAMSVQKISDEKQQVIELDTAPYISDERTMVPVRAIAEALNAKVDWIDETQTVVIVSE